MSSWSKHTPGLQLAWDGTSLGTLQRCPRLYQYTVVEGYRKADNPHLEFGSLFQEAVEVFQLARLGARCLDCCGTGVSEGNHVTGAVECSGCDGSGWVAEPLDIHAATLAMLRRAVQSSGVYEKAEDETWGRYAYTWHPWGGEVVPRWRCTGAEKFETGRRKCPNSKAGVWSDPAALLRTDWENHECSCPVCFSPIEVAEHFIPDHPQKNRRNLLLALLLFAERQSPEHGLQPYAFPDGTPAIEINVTVPMGRRAEDEDYLLVANFDEINSWRGRHYITDNKTTKNKLTTAHFRQFAPHAQFDFYDVVGSIALPDLDIAGIAVRGIQVSKELQDIKTVLLTKSVGQREETWRDINYWIDQAERFARDNYWPMNRSACQGCAFAAICDMDPEFRQASLDTDFVKRGPWDPIVRPGRRDTGNAE